MTLDIVIVNWNAGEALRNCVESVVAAAEGVELRRVVVVDNGSTDGSLEGLEGLNLPLVVIRNADNRGFGAACNQGAGGSEAELLLFLNPDTRLAPDSLAVPVAHLADPVNAGVGVVGIQLVDESGEVSRSCARAPRPEHFWNKMLGLDRVLGSRRPGMIMEEWPHGSTREVDHVIGAFYCIRRPLFERLGGFDERFFVYLEDVDLSARAAAAGFRSVYLTEARAFHRGGGTSDQVRARRLFYSLRSRIQYGHKHFSRAHGVLHALGTLAVEPVIRLGWAAGRGSWETGRETLEGYRLLWSEALSSGLFRSVPRHGAAGGPHRDESVLTARAGSVASGSSSAAG